MNAFLLLWGRRLWPYLMLLLVLASATAAVHRLIHARALELAHQRTAVQEVAAARADTVFVRDTVERRVAMTRYQRLRDSVRIRLTDTVLVAQALTAADTAIARSDSSLAKAARALEAHRILEGALRTELAIALHRRPARFAVRAAATMDFATNVPNASIEATARVTEHWSLLARVEQCFTIGEPVHRSLGVQYTF